MPTLRFQYLFDEGTGTAISDNSAYGNDGAMEYGVGWISAPYNPALDFYVSDNPTGQVRIPVIQPWGNQTTNLPTTSYTVMFWVNAGTRFPYSTTVINKMSNEGTYPHRFTRGWSTRLFTMGTGNRITRVGLLDYYWGWDPPVSENFHQFRVYKDFGTSTVCDGGWHHFAIFFSVDTWQGKMWFDMVEVTPTVTAVENYARKSSANNVDLLIGGQQYFPLFYPGMLYDIRLYEGEVSPTGLYPNIANVSQVRMTPEL